MAEYIINALHFKTVREILKIPIAIGLYTPTDTQACTFPIPRGPCPSQQHMDEQRSSFIE